MLFYEAMLHKNALPSGIVRRGSVEHILPRKPKLGSHWLKVFTSEDERYFCLHSLGNLGLISRETNAAVGIEDFSVKRSAYRGETFLSIADVEDVIEQAQPRLEAGEPENDWTPTVVRMRTEKMASLIWNELDVEI